MTNVHTRTKYKLIQNGEVIATDVEENIREKIEFLLEKEIGMFISLQESTDDGEFEFYLHTDNFEDYTEEDMDKVDEMLGGSLGIDKEEELAIRDLLNIDIVEVE